MHTTPALTQGSTRGSLPFPRPSYRGSQSYNISAAPILSLPVESSLVGIEANCDCYIAINRAPDGDYGEVPGAVLGDAKIVGNNPIQWFSINSGDLVSVLAEPSDPAVAAGLAAVQLVPALHLNQTSDNKAVGARGPMAALAYTKNLAFTTPAGAPNTPTIFQHKTVVVAGALFDSSAALPAGAKLYSWSYSVWEGNVTQANSDGSASDVLVPTQSFSSYDAMEPADAGHQVDHLKLDATAGKCAVILQYLL